jgi:hypothetical protein
MLKKGPRVGIGVLLVILGAKNTVYPYPYPPTDLAEGVGYYGLALCMILCGIWLIFRGRGNSAQSALAQEDSIGEKE